MTKPTKKNNYLIYLTHHNCKNMLILRFLVKVKCLKILFQCEHAFCMLDCNGTTNGNGVPYTSWSKYFTAFVHSIHLTMRLPNTYLKSDTAASSILTPNAVE